MKNKNYEIIDGVEKLEIALKNLKKAQKEFSAFSQEQVDKIFLAAASAASQPNASSGVVKLLPHSSHI